MIVWLFRNIALYLRREEEWVDSEVIPVKVSDMLEFTGLAEVRRKLNVVISSNKNIWEFCSQVVKEIRH